MHSREQILPIRWRLHLRSSPAKVYQMLASAEGRALFWAESALEENGKISFRFPNGQQWSGRVIEQDFPRKYVVEYFGGSTVTFELQKDKGGGTDLILTEEGVSEAERAEALAGWVSVLLELKAVVDFGVDLRNHDPERTWDAGYVDN